MQAAGLRVDRTGPVCTGRLCLRNIWRASVADASPKWATNRTRMAHPLNGGANLNLQFKRKPRERAGCETRVSGGALSHTVPAMSFKISPCQSPPRALIMRLETASVYFPGNNKLGMYQRARARALDITSGATKLVPSAAVQANERERASSGGCKVLKLFASSGRPEWPSSGQLQRKCLVSVDAASRAAEARAQRSHADR